MKSSRKSILILCIAWVIQTTLILGLGWNFYVGFGPIDRESFKTLPEPNHAWGCSEGPRSLTIVDGKYVLSRVKSSGKCSEGGGSTALYGRSADHPMCSTFSTLTGPKFYCLVPTFNSLFQDIVQHKENHTYEPLTF